MRRPAKIGIGTGRQALAACLAVLAFAAPSRAGEMVLSQFVFRDMDRDGTYDLGEPPIAGVPVRLTRPNAPPVVIETNLAGFANFVMSPDGGADIPGPGELSFEVLPPEGLAASKDAQPFSTTIRALPAAPGGMVAGETPPFVGLSPRLILSIGATPDDRVVCIGPNGTEQPAVGQGPHRHCDVAPGSWRIVWTSDTGAATRDLDVGQWPLRVPRPTRMPDGAEGEPVTVSFDDLISSNNLIEVPAGVAGMVWQNFVATHRMYYQGAGYINGTTSGEYSAYNSSGHVATMRSDTPYDLVSVNLTLAWPAGLGGDIRVEALRDGEVVAHDAFRGSVYSPTRFAPDWRAITELRIYHETYWQVVIDDLVIAR
ncbi:MAG: hypothetical protein VX874_17165 [Pseudomonadota bacterium]|nr:hypothetical protein [Pseudomonadota bacterium]